jgi:hypothetical protein
MRQRMLEGFVAGYYNGSVKPNLAEKDPTTGRDVDFLMDGRQFEKTNKSEVWSSSGAVGSGYQYRVVYKDKRFSALDQLLGMYTGSVVVAEEDRPAVEQRLYELVMLLIKEGRLPKTFKVQPTADARVDKLLSTVERLNQALKSLEMRVKSLEDARSGQASTEEIRT